MSKILDSLIKYLNMDEVLQLRELNKVIYDSMNLLINYYMNNHNLVDHTKFIKYFTLIHSINIV